VESTFHEELPPDVSELASLRRSLADWLAQAEVHSGATDAIILATHEAAANAVEHADARLVVTGSRDEDSVTVVVRDAGRWKESQGGEFRGLGLPLMQAVMSEVDVGSYDGGSVIRMRLTL
jgi:anti-sigma regulatory factor (Ser/Thr protein kinase)